MVDARSLDDLFAAALRGDRAPWPPEWMNEERIEAASSRLIYHGICHLMAEHFCSLKNWPSRIQADIQKEALAQTMWEMAHRQVLADLYEGLERTGVEALLLKGTAIAYLNYPVPAARRRGDTDLLIRAGDLATTRTVLANHGFCRPFATQGPFGDLHFEELWRLESENSGDHDIDLHWEVTNSRALSKVFNVDACFTESVAVSAIHEAARATAPVTRLIHGFVNRASHQRSGYFSIDQNHYGGDRLIWAYDYHLQAFSLREQDWEQLAKECIEREVAAICLDGLRFAQATLHTPVPDSVIDALESAPQTTPVSRYIYGERKLERSLADFRSTPGVAKKAMFVLARAFPSTRHMRAKYPQLERWPVSFLYVLRLIEASYKRG